MRIFTLTILLFLGAMSVAMAGPYDDALAAYRKGEWDKAFELLKPLAALDNAQSAVAQQRLGSLYERGKGTARDPAAAAKWFAKAAEQGDVLAQAHLGRLYRLGTGVPRDATAAAKWSIKAATQGNAVAQASLGHMALAGFGMSADAGAAAGWFKKAAEQGDADAMLALAMLAEAGKGVPKDVVQARKWYILASVDDGQYEDEVFARARQGKDALAGKMTPAQIAQADKLAEDWKPSAKR